MIYFLDGYNLLFSFFDSKKNFSSQREHLILFLHKQFIQHRLTGILFFDGKHRRDEESGLSYKSPLDIAYAPKGQSADAYIVEKIESEKSPSFITVVTNDKGLKAHARSAGAKVQSNEAFILFLKKRGKKTKAKIREIKDTENNISRLLKIFEERLSSKDDDMNEF